MGEAQLGKHVMVESVHLQEEVQGQKRKLKYHLRQENNHGLDLQAVLN